MENTRRFYFDNAATTWPKCAAAVDAAFDFVRHCGATSGRGSYTSAVVAESWLERARLSLSRLVGESDARSIAFCQSGTHALNSLLHGLIPVGSHVLTTAMEHNSVLRPLANARDAQLFELGVIPADANGLARLDVASEMLQESTRTLVLGHASNVTGAVNDLAAWTEFAKRHELTTIIDASQSLGYLPIDCKKWGVDALASAGHKGLRALAGTGFVMLNSAHWTKLKPLMQGGTGRASESIVEDPEWPHSIEVGNLNLPGIVSMAVAAEQLLQESSLAAGWRPTFELLVSGLQLIPGVVVVGRYDFACDESCVPVVSIHVDGWDLHDLGNILDAEFQIEARCGWHCAALVHRAVDTVESHGTLRFSTARSTTVEDVNYLLAALRKVLE